MEGGSHAWLTISKLPHPSHFLLGSGDHTVKIIDCYSGACVKVLDGHSRTPWVVRFHPFDPTLLASGSLDHRVVVWRVTTGEQLYVHNFGEFKQGSRETRTHLSPSKYHNSAEPWKMSYMMIMIGNACHVS
jgi:WD40 repeat protein